MHVPARAGCCVLLRIRSAGRKQKTSFPNPPTEVGAIRFRLYRTDLPGKPDIVLPRYGTVILVHGCFWHRHKGCRFAYTPKSRKRFWLKKFASNVTRDHIVKKALAKLGWKIATVWECELDSPEQVLNRLNAMLTRRAGPMARNRQTGSVKGRRPSRVASRRRADVASKER
jgi:DNA mismatch endonuclease (patch repair protein)